MNVLGLIKKKTMNIRFLQLQREYPLECDAHVAETSCRTEMSCVCVREKEIPVGVSVSLRSS
jgi:hypothetical protein